MEQSMPLLIDAKQRHMEGFEAISSSAVDPGGEEEEDEEIVAEQQEHQQGCMLESKEADTDIGLDTQKQALE
jgi:flagellar biosynthesis/type III secretory pathway protein FliH